MAADPTPLQTLKDLFDEQQAAYDACAAAQAQRGRGISRLLLQNWLSEIKRDLVRLAWKIRRLTDTPAARTLDRIAEDCLKVVQALSPAVVFKQEDDARVVAHVDLGPVAWRLRVVYGFLFFQIILEAALLLYSISLFTGFDPQTALTPVQWQSRADARGEVSALRLTLERAFQLPPPAAKAGDPSQAPSAKTPAAQEPAAKSPATPGAPAVSTTEPAGKDASPCLQPPCEDPAAPLDTSVLRGDVEGLMATLNKMNLSDMDRDFASRELEGVLGGLNQDPPAKQDVLRRLLNLEQRLASTANSPPPSPVILIILGSLLGMVAMTTQMNWKHRNQWDTLSYVPWYLMRMVTAPVVSLTAMSFLFQVSFTSDLKDATDLSAMGLRGASLLLIFGVAIFTGLFSNRVFDWLRARAQAPNSPLTPTAPAPTQPSGAANAGDNEPEEPAEAARRG